MEVLGLEKGSKLDVSTRSKTKESECGSLRTG